MLLADIAAVFTAELPTTCQAQSLPTRWPASKARPWPEFGKARKPISANQLANQLRKFGIAPRCIRIGTETRRGYDIADFADAFARFLPKAHPSRLQHRNNP